MLALHTAATAVQVTQSVAGSTDYRVTDDRQLANERLADALGWTGFTLERHGVGGRFSLRRIGSTAIHRVELHR
jgi:hypothetical protein